MLGSDLAATRSHHQHGLLKVIVSLLLGVDYLSHSLLEKVFFPFQVFGACVGRGHYTII